MNADILPISGVSWFSRYGMEIKTLQIKSSIISERVAIASMRLPSVKLRFSF